VSFIAFVIVWLQVSLVLFTFDEVLWIRFLVRLIPPRRSRSQPYSLCWWPIFSKFLDLVF